MKSLQLSPMPSAAPRAEVPGDTKIFIPENVCSKMISFAVEEGRLAYVRFTGGCDGNLKAIAALITGMRVEEVIEKLADITCGNKDTSCAGQLCIALRNTMED